MKNALCIALLITSLAKAQVPANGLVSDAEGNLFLALHAPSALTYDGFALPLSAKKSTYVLKLDANGDLTAISQADGAATIAGPLVLQNDSLYFAQAAFNNRGAGAGEIVLTKLSTDLSYRSTVTHPLPINARPYAVAYAQNHWTFVYAAISGQKLSYTVAGLSHEYADKWMKPLPAYHISGMQWEGNQAVICGSFLTSFRYGGQEVKSSGTDMFLLNINPDNGSLTKLRASITGNILGASIAPQGENYWIAGSLLIPASSGNTTSVFSGLVSSGLASINLTRSQTAYFSEGKALCTATDGSAYIAGNFSNTLLFEGQSEFTNEIEQAHQVFVMKMNPEGTVVWAKPYGSVADDEVFGIAPMPDGGVVLCYLFGNKGYASGADKFNDTAPLEAQVHLIRLNPAGEEVWKKILFTQNQ